MTLESISTVAALRARVREWRADGRRIGLVPTMGNLHAGHLALVQAARRHADRVIATIFVNPLQFGPNEDFGAYPRTLERDRERLAEVGAELLFAPTVDEVYPDGQAGQTRIEVPGLSGLLCGASRPGHFVGVATVVAKLFNMVQPDLAVFGEKDFQQLMVIRRMARELDFPIEILGVPTVREPDGLAMSSRNGYLSEAQRLIAPRLYRTLLETADRLRSGRRDWQALEQEAIAQLDACGFGPDYVAIRRAVDLAVPLRDDHELVVLAAARLGTARLIDNLSVSLT